MTQKRSQNRSWPSRNLSAKLGAICGAFVVCLTLASYWGCSLREAKRDNVILITLDTLRADHLGYNGYARARTPNLDRFAQEAFQFTRAFSTINTTLAAHAAMLTGQFPHTIGVPRNAFPLPDDVPLLQEYLHEDGYTTAAFISSLAVCSRMGLAGGFDHFDETFDLDHGDQLQRRAETTTQAVLDWLQSKPREPYFLWVHYFDPHYPYDPPAPYDTLYESDYHGPADGSMAYLRRIWEVEEAGLSPPAVDQQRMIDLYDGEIAYLDHWLGSLLEWYATPDKRNNSIILIAADHGESLTEHEYLFNHGRNLYQPSMHVPLLVRPSARLNLKPGLIKTPVQTHSIYPTILGLLGLPIPAGVGADNLQPLMQGSAIRSPSLVFGESSQPWRVEAVNPETYQNLHKAQMVIEYPWKLIVTPYNNETELYHLGRDPGELTNMAADRPERVLALRPELIHWREGVLRRGTRLDSEQLRLLRSLGYLK